MTGANGSASESWFRDGLRFECTQCGNCCTGGPGVVGFTVDEGRAIAAHLGLTEGTFLDRFTRASGAQRSLKELRTEYGHDCVFLDRTGGLGRAVCSIYEVRPMQCRTWPFWPENLETPEAWESAKRMMPCHGMNRGRVHSYVEITVERDRDRKSEAFGEPA
ncbi:MAG: YkgJ family cysteine cluster protein [Phycisphaerae bacterium]|nr:YkgJ family cysteine cluster protein [Phycisphaerae bacterium]